MRTSNFSFLVKKGVHSVWYNRMMSFASYCVLTVSLLMVGLASLAGIDINLVLSHIEDKNELLVYTDGELDQDKTNEISTALANSEHAKSVVFFSKEEAWEEWKHDDPDGAPVYDRMFNPMPNTFIITVNDLTKVKEAEAEFSLIDGVYKVEKSDEFAKFLIEMRTTMSIIGGAIIIALIVVSLVIIYNSARASVFSRRQEINIMKYVGATNAFVKIPFFIEGVFIGIVAGITSWLLTKIAYETIIKMFNDDVLLWKALGLSELMNFGKISLIVLAANCVAGILLSATGIIMSMGKHLDV